jgi:hypothetical protein
MAKKLNLFCPSEFQFLFYGPGNPAVQKKRAPIHRAQGDEIDVGFAPVIKIFKMNSFS